MRVSVALAFGWAAIIGIGIGAARRESIDLAKDVVLMFYCVQLLRLAMHKPHTFLAAKN